MNKETFEILNQINKLDSKTPIDAESNFQSKMAVLKPLYESK
jgi:hypothetical protein